MTRPTPCLLAVLLLAVPCAATAGSAQQKKASLHHAGSSSLAAETLDCSRPRDLTCGAARDSSNVGAPNQVSYYGCSEYEESAGEVVYRFVLQSYSTVSLRLDGMQEDLDLFVLSGCSPDACIGSSTGVSVETWSGCLPAGTYYVVVDGFDGGASAFRLSMSCTSCIPCTPDVANDTCEEATPVQAQFGTFRASGNTRCAKDDYTDGTCTGFSSLGRDIAYRIVMPPGCSITATLRDGADGVPLDRSMYLATSCADARNTCVAGSDAGVDAVESFTYATPAGGIYYLIVDSFGNSTSGDFELVVELVNCSVVPVEAPTWGRVKTLYR